MKLKPVIAEIAKENQRMGAEMTNTGLEISPKAINTREEVRAQKLQEAQAISEAVLDAEVRIGQLMRDVPKASHDRGNQYTGGKDPAVGSSHNKRKVIEDAGFSKTQAQRFETLAAHPEIVEQAKAEARENDDIVSRSEASHWRGSPALLSGMRVLIFAVSCDSLYQP